MTDINKPGKGMTTKFGLFVVKCMNIGDDIQSIAGLRFLPRVDFYIDRDNIHEVESIKLEKNEELKMIMNGWYTAGYEFWPPKNDSFVPLLTSIHINPLHDYGAVAERFSRKNVVRYLKKFGPVGARDLSTLEFFKKNGIDSYFSACMTLTLNPEKNVKKKDYILAINVSNEVYETIKKRTTREVIRMDVERTQGMTVEENLALAKYYLYMYQSAHCVVTTRLHATLPTIAIGGRTLFIIEGNVANQDFEHRFNGLHGLAHHVTAREFIDDNKMSLYDLENPPQNPDTYKEYRDKLVNICAEYTGFDNKLGYLQKDTINDIVLSPEFFSALTKISEESWDSYRFKHKLLIPDILKDDLLKIDKLEEEVGQLKQQIIKEMSPGIVIATKRLIKSILFKTRLKQRH